MKLRKEMLILTPKGAEELHEGTYQFDVTAKNILTLIEQGACTTDMVLQRSMFPYNAVTQCLHRLVRNKSVAVEADDGSASRSGGSDTGSYRVRDELHLKLGVAVSQARFALSNFCMDNFDSDNQYLVDAISLCVDVFSLQEVVNTLRTDVDELCPGRLPALIACVREINETDEASATPAPAGAVPSGARSHPEPKAPATSKPAPSPAEAKFPPASRPSAAQPEPLKKPAASSAPSTEPPRLEAAISIAQARFALTEFCLNEFGVQGQAFIDGVNRAGDVAALQKALNLIRTETLNRHRDKLRVLLACVHEINETAL